MAKYRDLRGVSISFEDGFFLHIRGSVRINNVLAAHLAWKLLGQHSG